MLHNCIILRYYCHVFSNIIISIAYLANIHLRLAIFVTKAYVYERNGGYIAAA